MGNGSHKQVRSNRAYKNIYRLPDRTNHRFDNGILICMRHRVYRKDKDPRTYKVYRLIRFLELLIIKNYLQSASPSSVTYTFTSYNIAITIFTSTNFRTILSECTVRTFPFAIFSRPSSSTFTGSVKWIARTIILT